MVLREVLYLAFALGSVAAAPTEAVRHPAGKASANELLRKFESKLLEEGLALEDIPTIEQAQTELFAELGFASTLQQTKLRKALKERGTRGLQEAPRQVDRKIEPKAAPTLTTTILRRPVATPQRTSKGGIDKTQLKSDVDEMRLRLAHRNSPQGAGVGGKRRLLPPRTGDVSVVVYVCGHNGEDKRPFVVGAANAAHKEKGRPPLWESDGVPAYSSRGTFVYRYDGYWHIGDLSQSPPVPTYSCGPACSVKDLRTPPLGVDFEIVDLDSDAAPDMTVQISDLPCKFAYKDGKIVQREGEEEL